MLIIIILLIIAVVLLAEGFLPSTFRLGSYDPSRYASDIVRRV